MNKRGSTLFRQLFSLKNRKYILLILAFTYFSFSLRHGQYQAGQASFISLKVEVQGTSNTCSYPFYIRSNGDTCFCDGEFIHLSFLFSTSEKKDTSILFDYQVFAKQSARGMEVFSGIQNDLNFFIQNCEFSQIIIENDKKEFTVFAEKGDFTKCGSNRLGDANYYCGDKARMLLEPYNICERIFCLTAQSAKGFKINILKNDLRINLNDQRIRLHYLFRPNERQQKLGFTESFVVSSNWIDLK